eukprot:394657-Amphidinium_carterae.1
MTLVVDVHFVRVPKTGTIARRPLRYLAAMCEAECTLPCTWSQRCCKAMIDSQTSFCVSVVKELL